jgi:glycosyltransferase involved in cell wall biosynthesis
MNIGFDGKRATMNFRGLGNYSRGIIEGLLDYSSEEIYLYTPNTDSPRAQEWLKNLHNSRLHVKKPATAIERKLHSLWRSFSVSTDLRKDNLDIYHGLSHEIPFSSRFIKAKKVVTIHDLIFMRFPEFFPFLDRVTYKAKFKFSCDHSDMVLAICEQTKSDLIEMLGIEEKKILVHYQSCDPVFYQMGTQDQHRNLKEKYKLHRPFILTVGAFEERKNQLGLIKAFSMLQKKDHDLVLIGAGKKYLTQCKELVHSLGLDSRVHFLSNISFTELPLFYQAAEVFCFPSFFEGFGLPIVESLFSKTPVVTSIGSCFPESGGPDSLYADPNRAEDIADKLSLVLNDKLLQNSMTEKGYEFVQRFHRKHSTESLLDCYSQL